MNDNFDKKALLTTVPERKEGDYDKLKGRGKILSWNIWARGEFRMNRYHEGCCVLNYREILKRTQMI